MVKGRSSLASNEGFRVQILVGVLPRQKRVTTEYTAGYPAVYSVVTLFFSVFRGGPLLVALWAAEDLAQFLEELAELRSRHLLRHLDPSR